MNSAYGRQKKRIIDTTSSLPVTGGSRGRGEGIPPCPPPFQSHAVATAATFLFEACSSQTRRNICEHDKKYSEKREIFKRNFCPSLLKRFQLRREVYPLTCRWTPLGAKPSNPRYKPPFPSFWIRQRCQSILG